MSIRHLAAIVGFAFVAIWIFDDFGSAILCLVGAVVFYALVALLERQPDLAAMRDRLTAGGGGARAR
ncbi:MAG: hypothetical protein R3C15_17855 [Thermoleophilia bacterium]